MSKHTENISSYTAASDGVQNSLCIHHLHLPWTPFGVTSHSFCPLSLRKPIETSTESSVGFSRSKVNTSKARISWAYTTCHHRQCSMTDQAKHSKVRSCMNMPRVTKVTKQSLIISHKTSFFELLLLFSFIHYCESHYTIISSTQQKQPCHDQQHLLTITITIKLAHGHKHYLSVVQKKLLTPTTCWLTRCAMKRRDVKHSCLSFRLNPFRNWITKRFRINSPFCGNCKERQKFQSAVTYCLN